MKSLCDGKRMRGSEPVETDWLRNLARPGCSDFSWPLSEAFFPPRYGMECFSKQRAYALISDEVALCKVRTKAKRKLRVVILGFGGRAGLCLWPASGRGGNSRFCYLPWGMQGSRKQESMRRAESWLLQPVFRGMVFLNLDLCIHTHHQTQVHWSSKRGSWFQWNISSG